MKYSFYFQLVPVVTRFFNYCWSCMCSFKTKVGVYGGTFCWHEEWAIRHLTGKIQEAVNKQNEYVEISSTNK